MEVTPSISSPTSVAELSTRVVRVLHVHSGNMIGGVEAVLLTLAQSSDAYPEVEHSFALCFDQEFARKLRDTRARLFVLPPVRLRDPLSLMKSRRELESLLRSNVFDVVVFHSAWSQAVFLSAAKKFHKPVALYVHGAYDGHWLQRLAPPSRVDLLICNSEFTRATLDQRHGEAKCEIVHSPVVTRAASQERSKTRAQLGASPQTVVILAASRMEAWKGHRALLRAVADLPSGTLWKLWIAGGPQTSEEVSYFESLRRLAESLGIAHHVDFLGQRGDVPDLMLAADIFCQANEDPEPFGVVFVEALRAGLPVVTFDMGGPQEILTADCGMLAPPGRVDLFSHSLRLLINDASLRRQMSEHASARAKQICDPLKQIRAFDEALTQLVRATAGQ